jgi:hypothetical protein
MSMIFIDLNILSGMIEAKLFRGEQDGDHDQWSECWLSIVHHKKK